MPSYSEQNAELIDLAKKTIVWVATAMGEIHKAGGCPELIIEQIPTNLLVTMIRNDIHLVWKRS
jgi:hypothetical protein